MTASHPATPPPLHHLPSPLTSVLRALHKHPCRESPDRNYPLLSLTAPPTPAAAGMLTPDEDLDKQLMGPYADPHTLLRGEVKQPVEFAELYDLLNRWHDVLSTARQGLHGGKGHSR